MITMNQTHAIYFLVAYCSSEHYLFVELDPRLPFFARDDRCSQGILSSPHLTLLAMIRGDILLVMNCVTAYMIELLSFGCETITPAAMSSCL